MSQNLYSILSKYKLLSKTKLDPFKNFNNPDLFEIVRDNFQIPEEKLLTAIAKEYSLAFEKLNALFIDHKFLKQFKNTILQEYRFLPIYEKENYIYIATDNPFDTKKTDYLKKTYQKKIRLILISSVDLNTYLGQKNKQITSLKNTILDKLIILALEKKASDIHINRKEKEATIKFRINGQLHFVESFDLENSEKLMAILKFQAGMDISKIIKPQDGRISYDYKNQKYDMRVASLPTVYGEDFVLRLFNTTTTTGTWSELGFTSKNKKVIEKLLRETAGLILVTGTTGSGKSTTLYSFLEYLKQDNTKNIVSLEDPVEYILDGVRQSQINTQAGYTFVNGLKAVLRQDPDIIMIGEIRDRETAKIALDAAYTGHLVLATLHTTNVQATLLRLMSFELDPFIIQHSLKGIISQKLVARLCPYCRKEIKIKGFKKAFHSIGCQKCLYTKQDGRILLSEIWTAKKKKHKKTSFHINTVSDSLNDLAFNGYSLFTDDLTEKIETGLVSYQEASLVENAF
jgi:type IV pilus assembly protein PilB